MEIKQKIENLQTINDCMNFIEGSVNDFVAGEIKKDEFYGHMHQVLKHIRAKQRENMRKKVLLIVIDTIQNETIKNCVLLKINSEI
jgi:hypothetical protein